MRNLFITLLLLLSSIVWAQPQSTAMQAGRTADGIVYFLPKTAIRFHLLVEKKSYTPGAYARYAEKYLRLSGIEQEEQVSYSIASYQVTAMGVRDTSKCYAVKLKGGKCETAEVRLSEDGVLQAINAEPIAPKVIAPITPAARRAANDPHRYLNTDVLSASSKAKQADLIARQIMDLRERRQQFIMGEADEMPQDEQQLKRMLDEIDQQHAALMTLFTGTVQRDTIEKILVVCPEKEVRNEVVFRLSEKLGIVDKDDLAGVPYYMTIEDMHHTTMQKYALPVSKKTDGFYLNVPGRIKLTLARESHFLASFELSAAQFGFVELRDGNLFKRYVTHMQLNPTTGAVETVHADIPKK